MNRRRFLGLTLAACAAASWRPAAALGQPARTLSLRNLHTEETLNAAYWREGRYVPEALRGIDRLLRDHRTGEVHEIDRGLLDVLHELSRRLDTPRFEVISGYRSPTTNTRLAAASRGVVVNSYHTLGMAIDVRVPDRRLDAVRDTALALGRGGVGYYPRDGFVHLDIGRVRRW